MCRKIIRKINDFGATGVPKSIEFSFPKLKFSFPKPGGTGRRNVGRGPELFFDILAPLGLFWMIFGTPRNRTGHQKRSKKINTATF